MSRRRPTTVDVLRPVRIALTHGVLYTNSCVWSGPRWRLNREAERAASQGLLTWNRGPRFALTVWYPTDKGRQAVAAHDRKRMEASND